MKFLATHYTGNIGYYLRLFMQTQFQLGSYGTDQFKLDIYMHVALELSNKINLLSCL